MYNREEYLNLIRELLIVIKRIKQQRKVSGDMDLMDEIRTMSNLFNILDRDWCKGLEAMCYITGEFLLNTDLPEEKARKLWSEVSALFQSAREIVKNAGYISTNKILLEQLIAEYDQSEKLSMGGFE